QGFVSAGGLGGDVTVANPVARCCPLELGLGRLELDAGLAEPGAGLGQSVACRPLGVASEFGVAGGPGEQFTGSGDDVVAAVLEPTGGGADRLPGLVHRPAQLAFGEALAQQGLGFGKGGLGDLDVDVGADALDAENLEALRPGPPGRAQPPDLLEKPLAF